MAWCWLHITIGNKERDALRSKYGKLRGEDNDERPYAASYWYSLQKQRLLRDTSACMVRSSMYGMFRFIEVHPKLVYSRLQKKLF